MDACIEVRGLWPIAPLIIVCARLCVCFCVYVCVCVYFIHLKQISFVVYQQCYHHHREKIIITRCNLNIITFIVFRDRHVFSILTISIPRLYHK